MSDWTGTPKRHSQLRLHSIYEGDFEKGNESGIGTLTLFKCENRKYYRSSCNPENQPISWNKYTGPWSNGKPAGKGEFTKVN